MKKTLLESLAVVSQFWPLIILVGIGGIFFINGNLLILSMLGAIMSISIGIIVYGRIINYLMPAEARDNWIILKENWFNYLIVMVVVGAPVLALRLFAGNILPSPVANVVLETGLRSALAVLTIFVLPLVFLRKTNIPAIPAGIFFLFKIPVAGAWIGGVVVVAHVIHGAGGLVIRTMPVPWSIVLAMSIGVLTALLLFVSFTAALRVLLESPRQMPGNNA